MKYLFIAEKPSLMREVRSCYQNHKSEVIKNVGEIDFVAMAGHLCTNFLPDDYEEWNGKKWNEVDYPIVPKNWGIKPIADARSKKLLSDIKKMVKNYDAYIVGTDSDTEGYGIYYLLEHYLHMEKKPALRFMEHSLTDKEILKSLLSMTDYHHDPVHIAFTQSFLIRSRADWLYGMNLSRCMSLQVDQLMNIGRVKAPTIKLIYDNSMAIENFKPEKYYQLTAIYPEGFTGTLCDKAAKALSYMKKEELPSPPLDGKVIKKEAKEQKTKAPQLYDLAAIQAEAGQQLGLSPSRTLEVVQSLYETHKYISYPRTQCRYVSTEKAKEFPQLIKQAKAFPELVSFVDRITDTDKVFGNKSVVNDAEVAKESHDALLPTTNIPDPTKMSSEESAVCIMIYKRMLAQFLPLMVEEKTTLMMKHGEYLFTAKGKSIKDPGWRALYGIPKDALLPNLSEGDALTAKEMRPAEKTTTPPKRLTQATLLTAMMNIAKQVKDPVLRKSLVDSKGIGTPATRAAIIGEILKKGYAVDKKGLYITQVGKNYIENMKDLDIISPVFAAQMDMKIKKIQRQEADYDSVYSEILTDLNRICNEIPRMETKGNESSFICPKCGKKLKIGRFNYRCGCGLEVPKELCKVKLSDKVIEEILSGKKTKKMKFTKKDGSKFEAALVLKDGKIGFDFSSGISCPLCGKEVKVNKGGAFCDCGLTVYRKIGGKELSDGDIKKILSKGKLEKTGGFISKAGKEYEAALVLSKEDKKVHMDFGTDSGTGGSTEDILCPFCGKNAKMNRGGIFCDCGLTVYRKTGGKELSDEELKKLVTKKKLGKSGGFVSKAGKEYEAALILSEDDKKVHFEFD